MVTEKVKAIMILEILGKPAEHLKETLKKMTETLGKEKTVKITHQKIAEPKPLENEEGLFTSFVELEIETDIQTLMLLTFAYMPSHLEIIEPEDLSLRNSDLNIFFNELSRKLHQYDELAKAMVLERQTIAKQIQEGKITLKKPKKKKVKKKTSKKKK